IAFATELFNTALQQQSKSFVSEDVEEEQDGGNTADGENTADTTDPDEFSVTREDSEVSLYRWSLPCAFLLLETYREMENTLNNGKFLK
ncbi:hypothetical protein JTB14_010556, partial [Gonioctena quinquepunctata]